MSYFLSVNGERVVDGVISLPRVGCWHADFNLDAVSTVGALGPVTVNMGDGALQMQGYCFRFGLFADYVRMRVVGGTGGLRSTALPPKSYQSTPIQTVLSDVLRTAGESLSTTSDQSITNFQLNYWANIATGNKQVGSTLMSLLKEAPLGPSGQAPSWRMASTTNAAGQTVFDGSIWVGYDTWPASPSQEGVDYVYEFEDATVGKWQFASDLPNVFPGTTVTHIGPQGPIVRQVTYVRHEVQAQKGLRTIAYYEV